MESENFDRQQIQKSLRPKQNKYLVKNRAVQRVFKISYLDVQYRIYILYVYQIFPLSSMGTLCFYAWKIMQT